MTEKFYSQIGNLIEDLISELIDNPAKVKVPVSSNLVKGSQENVPNKVDLGFNFSDMASVETPQKGFARYFGTLSAALEDKGVPPEKVYEIIALAIKEFEDQGLLPKFPDSDKGDDMDKWLQAAASSGLGKEIMYKF